MSLESVEAKLKEQLQATHFNIVDNSWQHAGHAGNTSTATVGTHLALTVVSPQFNSLNLMERHRLIHKTLKEEMAEHIHALEIKTFTPEEWQNKK